MPHSKGVTPETSDERASSSRNPNAHDNGENPPMAAGRRDENSISFRHFLQPHSDVVPTTTRHNRSSRGVDMGDGASSSVTLPDFVQDHLVLESVASASGSNLVDPQTLHSHHASGSALDNMSVLNSFPDFTTSQRNQSCMSKRNRRHQENVPNNGDGSASSSHGPVALPDFLSDGPMLCSNNITDSGHNNNAPSTSSPSNASATVGASSSSSLHRVDNTNRDSDSTSSQQLERLRRELAEKSRRLSQLENDFTISRNEASMFEMAYHTCQQSLEAATRRALAAEAQLAFFKDHYTDKPNRKRSDNCNAAVLSYPGQNPGSSTRNIPNSVNIDSNRVLEIARSSEILVGQLLEQIDELKYVAASDLKGEDCRQSSSSGKDKGKTKDGLKPSKQ